MKKFAKIIIKGRFIIFALVMVATVICALCISKVNLNSDMTKYLSDSFNMKKGIDIMSKEFSEQESANIIRVMFKDLEEERKEDVAKELENIQYVDSITYDIDSKDYNKGDYTLYQLTTEYEYDSEEEQSIHENIKKIYKDDTVTVINNAGKATLSIKIVIAALIIMFAILFIMSRSWVEPILFMFVIAVAIVLNMGTNIFRESVSNTTFSIAAILQLALSMDYSIILLNRYRQEKKLTDNKVDAITNALAGSFSSITSSAFTTFIGLLMLVFMNYKLGEDLGVVLAKGVLCSWFCVITILPTVIIAFDKAIFKTAKKTLHVPMDKIAHFSYKFKKAMPVIFIILFIASYYLQNITGFIFATSGNDEISTIFPNDNVIVLLYNNKDEDRVASIEKKIEHNKNVKSIISYPTTLGKECTSEELADMVGDYAADTNMDIDKSLLDILYYDYYMKGQTPKIEVGELINFIADDVVTNKTFAKQLDEDIKEQVDEMKKFADGDTLSDKMTVKELAKFFDMKETDLESLFVLYYSEKGGVNTGSMTLNTFVSFISEDVMKNDTYSSMFNEDTKEQISMLKTYVDKEKMTNKMTYKEAAKLLGIDSETVKLLYVYYYANQDSYKPSSMTIEEFVDFMLNKVSKNSTFASQFNKDTLSQINTMKSFTNKETLNKKVYSEKMSSLLGMDKAMIDVVYAFYYGTNASGATITITLPQFVDFLEKKIMTNPMLASNFNESMKASISTMNQLISVALSGQSMAATQLAGVLGMDEQQVSGILAMSGTDSMTLPDFTNFMVTTVLTNETYSQMIDEATKQSLYQMNSLLQMAVSGAKVDATTMASIFGIDASQVMQLYVYYTGININKKQMSIVELVDYLLGAKESGGAIGAAITDDIVTQLTTLKNIMNLSMTETKLSYTDLGKVFGMDSSTLKMLYTLKNSYGDTSSWKLSMQTIVNYLVDNSKMLGSMMDSSMIRELKMAQKLINGAVNETKYTAKDMAVLLGMDSKQLTQLYLLYISEHGNTSKWGTTPQKLIEFLVNTVLLNKDYADMFDKDTANTLKNAKVVVDAVVSKKKYSAHEVADMLDGLADGLDKNMVELLYLYYGSKKNSQDDWTMSIEGLFNYLADEVVEDERFDDFLDDSFKEEIDDMKVQLNDGINQLVGKSHSLMMISTSLPNESDETNNFIANLYNICDETNEEEVYLVGNSVMNYEMKQAFKSEIWLMTILTAFSIFVIVALTFRSFLIPTLLVLIVQCGVYVTVASSGLRGDPLQFIAYLMVQCILMGATIDYAILFTNYYREHRKDKSIKEALKEAYSGSIHTIFTSGAILVCVTGIIGFGVHDLVGETCLTIAVGSFVAILLILFVLPGTIAVFDKMLLRRERKRQEKLKEV